MENVFIFRTNARHKYSKWRPPVRVNTNEADAPGECAGPAEAEGKSKDL